MIHAQAQRHLRRDPKMRIINVLSRRTISEIKLKRTDTTLDLSQKAKLQNALAKSPNVGGGLEGLTELKIRESVRGCAEDT